MKEWNAHERNEDKEVEILDFNDKQKRSAEIKQRQVQEGQSTSSLVRCRHRERQRMSGGRRHAIRNMRSSPMYFWHSLSV